MADIDEVSQRKLLEMNGWHPLDKLGEGGGARVFKVVAQGAINRLIDPLLTPMDREKAIAQAKALAQTIVEFADGTEPVIAAGKVAKDPNFRTAREVRILKEIQHAHLIRPIAIDPSPEPRWYVMPVMKRGTLAGNASRFRGDCAAVLRGMRQIASALEAMHARDAVHRDVKPGNVFVADDGDWILGDPGVAYVPGGDEETSTRPVSKDWFPRWFEDEYGHSPRVDVYMLAATAISLLTGKKPLDPSHFQKGRLHLPTMFTGVRGATEMQEFLAGLFVAEPKNIKATRGSELCARAAELAKLVEDDGQDALRTEVRALRAQLAEPRLLFMFGRSAHNDHPGNHDGLQMVPVWISAGTTRLHVDVTSSRVEAEYVLELWSGNVRVFATGILTNGHHEMQLDAAVGSGWRHVRVRCENGLGTGEILRVVIHGVIAGS